MNKTVKNLLMNLYFLKQIIKTKDTDKAKMYIENESGLEIEQLINEPSEKTLKEAVSNLTMALAQLNTEDLSLISNEYIEFFKILYYHIIDLENNFITEAQILDNLNILFEFPIFEATLLHFVQNEMIKDRKGFNNVVLSTYIHVSHIKFLALIDQQKELDTYLYEIGIDNDSSLEVNLDKHEVELIKNLSLENKEFADVIINYFNSISNELIVGNLPAIITSCEYVLSNLKHNVYIKNIL